MKSSIETVVSELALKEGKALRAADEYLLVNQSYVQG